MVQAGGKCEGAAVPQYWVSEGAAMMRTRSFALDAAALLLEFGDTAAIHLVVPNVSRVDVPMTRTERNAVAFDYFCKKFKDGINV
jgi:hypothetical protein